MERLKRKKLTQQKLKELMRYDPDAGVFYRKIKNNNFKIASASNTRNGHLQIHVAGSKHYIHRLAWLYVHGYHPENEIDHINRIPTDNRIENLREASRSCNIRNSKLSKSSVSGVKGVYWHRRRQKWRAGIYVNGISKYLGVFDELIEAACARLAAEQCLGWAGCESNSPAFQYVKNNIITREALCHHLNNATS